MMWYRFDTMKEKLRVYVVGFKDKTVVIVRAKNRQIASSRAVRATRQRYQDVVFKVVAHDLDPYKIGRDELRVVQPELSSGRGFYIADVDRLLCAWLLKRGFWDETTPFVVAATSAPMTPWFVPSPPQISSVVRLAEPSKMLIDETSFNGNDEFVSFSSKIRGFFRNLLTK